MYSIGIYDYRECKSKVNKVNLPQAAMFLSSIRHPNEKIYIKEHGDNGTRYIQYKTLRKKIEEYMERLNIQYCEFINQTN